MALDRIAKYLTTEDIHYDYIKKDEISNSDQAIKVENGNFYWLTEEEKALKKEKEEKEKTQEPQEKKEETETKDIKEVDENKSLHLESEKAQILDAEVEDKSPLPNAIASESQLVLEDINLTIKKGSFVAILGE